MIEYPIGESGQFLVFTDEVLKHFKLHRQVGVWHREAGGQLFARIENSRIIVVEATGPRPGDRRTRTSYLPDRVAERIEIENRFRLGIHFIGDWHTHPEETPHPSSLDFVSIGESVLKSVHDLNGFILVVVGKTEAPDGLSVSLHDGRSVAILKPINSMNSPMRSD